MKGEHIMGNSQLGQIRRDLRRAAEHVRALGRAVDDAEHEVARLQEELHAQGFADPLDPQEDWPSPAEPVAVLTVKLLGDGRSRVSREDRNPLGLSRRLTELLLFAASAPPGADGVVSFRLALDAAKTLGVRKAYVFTLVSRLRQALEQQGWNPGLLQTDRCRPCSRIRFLTRKLHVIKGL